LHKCLQFPEHLDGVDDSNVCVVVVEEGTKDEGMEGEAKSSAEVGDEGVATKQLGPDVVNHHGLCVPIRVWSMEKGVSALLVPGIIVPFLYTTPVTDGIFCAMMTLHSYWHTEAMVVDYIRPKLFGGNTFIPNLCRALCFALHAFILGALFYYNYTDIGIINSIKMFWKL
jgi:hypothetical protein